VVTTIDKSTVPWNLAARAASEKPGIGQLVQLGTPASKPLLNTPGSSGYHRLCEHSGTRLNSMACISSVTGKLALSSFSW